MNEFTYLRLKGLPFFEDQTFDLSQKGISLVLGRNLDSSNHGTNGCGKSLFFGQLPELMIGEPTIGDRKDVIRKGGIEFGLKKSNGSEYVIRRWFKPGEKLSISKDGKDLEYRELTAAKAALRKLLPYNAEEVLSLIYLDSRLPHPLVRGTSSTRKAFFTNFFRMNTAPTMRKVVKAELDALAIQSGSYTTYRERLSDLKHRLKESDVDKLRLRQKKLKRELDELEQRAKRYSEAARIKEYYQEHVEDYAELVGHGVHTCEEAQAKAERLDAKINSINESLAEWKRYTNWRETQKERQERREQVESELSSAGELGSWSSKKLATRFEELTAECEGIEKSVESINSKLKSVSESAEAEIRRDIKEAKSKLSRLETETDKCPTCGAAYDNRHAKKEISLVKDKLETLRGSLEDLLSKREPLQKKKAALEEDLERATEALAKVRRVRKLVAEKAGWEEGESVKKPMTDREKLLADRERHRDLYQKMVSAKPAIHATEAYKALSSEDKALLKGEPPTDSLLKTSAELGELKMHISELDSLQEEYATLTDKIAKLKSALDDKPALELLYQGLSQKGAPSVMINLACKRLEQQVNKYARLLFPEDFRFTFDLQTQFNILVTRKYGKREVTSDVRKLSGAESLLFSLILLIGLLSFVPAKNRCNLLILDEPTAAFGPEMINAFVKFLPVLNSVIPHIIVITPLPHNTYNGAKVFTVVKKNGKSRIIEGDDIMKGKVHDYRRSRGSSSVPAGRKASV